MTQASESPLDGSVVRVLAFAAAADDGAILGIINDAIMPPLLGSSGLIRTIVAKRDTKASQHFLIITMWAGAAAMEAAVREGVAPAYQRTFAPYLRGANVLIIESEIARSTPVLGTLSVIRLAREARVGSDPPATEGTASIDGPLGTERRAGHEPDLVIAGRTDDEEVAVLGWASSSGLFGRLVDRVRLRLGRDRADREYRVLLDVAGVRPPAQEARRALDAEL